MYNHSYSFCSYVFEIDTIYDYFYEYAKEYISDNKADYYISISKEELDEFAKEYNNEPLYYLETLLIQKKVAESLYKHHIYIMHGSSLYIDDKDNGYIFTGPSGVGKSTHVGKLINRYKDRIVIVNDDKPFISKEDDKYYLYGSPWSGKSHISINDKAQLKAIFILYQAKTNEIKLISPNTAINMLYKQIYIPKGKESSSLGLDLLVNVSKEIPIYHLGVNLEDNSIDLASRIMLGDH